MAATKTQPFIASTSPESMMTPAQVAEVLKIKEQTLAKWRTLGRGPRFVRCHSAVRYKPSDVASFIESGLSPCGRI